MKLTTKFANALYFIIWTPFTICAYALLIDDYYVTSKVFGPMLGALALAAYLIVLLILTIAFFKNKMNRSSIKKKLLLYSIPLILLSPAVIIYLLPNNVEPNQHIIEVSYNAWGCDCANWSLNVDNGKPLKEDAINREHVFVEAANNKIKLPDSIGKTGDIIQLTGQFYEKKGFPKGYSSQEFPEKARVFRYTSYKIIDNENSSQVAIHSKK